MPNILSAARLALGGAFFFLPAEWRLATTLIGGLTDLFDGMIARGFDAKTASGKLLDAVADKVFALAVVVTLCVANEIQWWQAGVVLVRDFTVLVLAIVTARLQEWSSFTRMSPRLIGKATTAAVYLWLVVVLATRSQTATNIAFGAAAALSVFAAFDYLSQFRQAWRERFGR